ncbi:UNVERIFIED_ORG: surface lipoprotein-related protein [Clostridium botulinum]|nr:surface lipoprotein-related protein [Clostridium botulinum]
MKEQWYEKAWATVLFLFVFWPAGLYLMWKYRSINKIAKILITIAIVTIRSSVANYN